MYSWWARKFCRAALWYLSRFASKVTVLIRGPEVTASKYLVDAMNANPKIEILLNTDLIELKARTRLSKSHQDTKRAELQNARCFCDVCFHRRSTAKQVVSGLLMCSDKGYILTGPD